MVLRVERLFRKEALNEHRIIWNAIVARDKEKVHAAIELHSNNSYKHLIAKVENGQTDFNGL